MPPPPRTVAAGALTRGVDGAGVSQYTLSWQEQLQTAPRPKSPVQKYEPLNEPRPQLASRPGVTAANRSPVGGHPACPTGLGGSASQPAFAAGPEGSKEHAAAAAAAAAQRIADAVSAAQSQQGASRVAALDLAQSAVNNAIGAASAAGMMHASAPPMQLPPAPPGVGLGLPPGMPAAHPGGMPVGVPGMPGGWPGYQGGGGVVGPPAYGGHPPQGYQSYVPNVQHHVAPPANPRGPPVETVPPNTSGLTWAPQYTGPG